MAAQANGVKPQKLAAEHNKARAQAPEHYRAGRKQAAWRDIAEESRRRIYKISANVKPPGQEEQAGRRLEGESKGKGRGWKRAGYGRTWREEEHQNGTGRTRRAGGAGI